MMSAINIIPLPELAKLYDATAAWQLFCPLRDMRRLSVNGLVTPTTFPNYNSVESEVVAAMRLIDGNIRYFKTQAHRIGGQTFFVAHGPPEDFVNFLGRRKMKKPHDSI